MNNIQTIQDKMLMSLKKLENKHVSDIFAYYKTKPQNSKSSYVNSMGIALTKNGFTYRLIQDNKITIRSLVLDETNQISESLAFEKIEFKFLKKQAFEDTEMFHILKNGLMLNLFNQDFVYIRSLVVRFTEEQKEKAKKAFETLRDNYQTTNEHLIRITEDLFMHTRHKDNDSKIKKLQFANALRSDLYWFINKKEIVIA